MPHHERFGQIDSIRSDKRSDKCDQFSNPGRKLLPNRSETAGDRVLKKARCFIRLSTCPNAPLPGGYYTLFTAPDAADWSPVQRLTRTRRNVLRAGLAFVVLGWVAIGGATYIASAAQAKRMGAIDIHWQYLYYQSSYTVPVAQTARDLKPYAAQLPKITVTGNTLQGCVSVSRATGAIGPYKFVAMMCQAPTSNNDWSYDWDGTVDGHTFYFNYPYSGGALTFGWDGKAETATAKILGRTKGGSPDSWSFKAATTLVKVLNLGIQYPQESRSASESGNGAIGGLKVSYKLTATEKEGDIGTGANAVAVGFGQLKGTYSVG